MTENTPENAARAERVRQILDRVAAGDLSSNDAVALIAAANQSDEAAAPAAEPADEPAGSSAGEGTDDLYDDVRADPPPRPEPVAEPVQDTPGGSVQDTPGGSVQDSPSSGEQDHADLPVPAGVRRIVVRAIGRRVKLIGEPSITGVSVDGPHQIKRDGDTLVVHSDGDMGVSIDGLSMLRTRSVGDLKSQMGGFAKELAVRVNPDLHVEVEVTGGSVTAERLPSLAKVRVTAGTARVSDVDGPIDLLVQAGSAHLDAQLTKGRSRVRVESGSANVQLRRGSDVRVHSDAQLGRITWSGAVNGQSADVEIGQGRAGLDVEVLMGAAQISSD